MKYLVLICAFGLMIPSLFADDFSLLVEEPSQMVCKVLQDPKTKVIFYLESNRHHLSAISPKGTLLWQMDTWANLQKEKGIPIEQLEKDNLINFIDLYKPKTPWAALPLENLGVTNRDDYLTVSFNDSVLG